MQNRLLTIVTAIALLFPYTAPFTYAEAGADRDALLTQAEVLSTPWDSPGEKDDGTDTNPCMVYGLAGLPDGSILAAQGPQNMAGYWYDADFPQLVRLEAADGTRTVLSEGAGYSQIAVAAGQGLVAVADRETAWLFSIDELTDPDEEWGDLGQNSALVFLSDGGMLATGGRNAYLHLLNTEWENRDRALSGHAGSITALASGGALLFSAGADGALKIWDPNTAKLVKTLRPGRGRMVGLQPTAGGKGLHVVFADGSAVLYDLASYRGSAWNTGLGAVALCAFSQDGGLAAFHDGKDTVVVWDLSGSRETERIAARVSEGHALTALAFSADNGRVLLGYSDGTVSARVMDAKVLELLSRAGLSESKRNSWLGERRLAIGDAAGAVRCFQAAGDAEGIARAGRALLAADGADAAETLFRRSADRDGLVLAGRYYLEHGAWAAALRCLSDTQGRAAAAAAVGDAAFDAQAFDDALEYYLQASDASRLTKLAQALFVRRNYSGAANAYSKAGDKAGLRRAAEALFKAGSRTDAARLLMDAGDAATVSSWAASLLASRDWRDAAELCALLKDTAGARRAAAALQEAKDPDGAFRAYMAIGDRTAAKAIPDGMVAEGSAMFRALESFKDMADISQKLGQLFSGAAELYELGGMKEEVTASLPAYVANYNYIFPMVWYSAVGQEEKIKGVADTAFSYGVLIASLVGYSAVQDKEGMAKVAQAMMRARRYEEAVIAYTRLDDTEGLNAAAAALMASGNVKLAEEIYRDTGSTSGLSALAANAKGAGDATEAAKLYAEAGNAAAVLAMAQEAEAKGGPAAAADLYALVPDGAVVKREAARLIEAGFFAEGRKLLEAAADPAGLAALAQRYADLGVFDEALDIYINLGDGDSVTRIQALKAVARPASGGRQTTETVDAKKKRAAAALGRKDWEEAGIAYGELGDYTNLMRALKASMEDSSAGSSTARGLARRFAYKPGFLAVAQKAEQEEDWTVAGECYADMGDREALRAFAHRMFEKNEYMAEDAIKIFGSLDDAEGLAKVARIVLTKDGLFDSSFDEHYGSITAALGDEATSRLADEFLKEGQYRLPVAWYVGRGDRAAMSRCAAALLDADETAFAAALYVQAGDREGMARVAAAVLAPKEDWQRQESLARALYRALGDKAGLARCASYALAERRRLSDMDYRDAARLCLEAGDRAGLLAVAEAFDESGQPLPAAHWARVAGDEKKAAAYMKSAGKPAVARIRLQVERSSYMEQYDDHEEAWWEKLIQPVNTDLDEPNSVREIRQILEKDGFLVVGEGEGEFDYEISLGTETTESESGSDKISFRMADAGGKVLLSMAEENLDTEDHALLLSLPEVVRQLMAE